nr:uncharacterized protein CI109_004516 [Kwoniella shandongensis]KAA5527223.1 hypothetical protein CI109_004516 [Kwoniella shandongensis]
MSTASSLTRRNATVYGNPDFPSVSNRHEGRQQHEGRAALGINLAGPLTGTHLPQRRDAPPHLSQPQYNQHLAPMQGPPPLPAVISRSRTFDNSASARPLVTQTYTAGPPRSSPLHMSAVRPLPLRQGSASPAQSIVSAPYDDREVIRIERSVTSLSPNLSEGRHELPDRQYRGLRGRIGGPPKAVLGGPGGKTFDEMMEDKERKARQVSSPSSAIVNTTNASRDNIPATDTPSQLSNQEIGGKWKGNLIVVNLPPERYSPPNSPPKPLPVPSADDDHCESLPPKPRKETYPWPAMHPHLPPEETPLPPSPVTSTHEDIEPCPSVDSTDDRAAESEVRTWEGRKVSVGLPDPDGWDRLRLTPSSAVEEQVSEPIFNEASDDNDDDNHSVDKVEVASSSSRPADRSLDLDATPWDEYSVSPTKTESIVTSPSAKALAAATDIFAVATGKTSAFSTTVITPTTASTLIPHPSLPPKPQTRDNPQLATSFPELADPTKRSFSGKELGNSAFLKRQLGGILRDPVDRKKRSRDQNEDKLAWGNESSAREDRAAEMADIIVRSEATVGDAETPHNRPEAHDEIAQKNPVSTGDPPPGADGHRPDNSVSSNPHFVRPPALEEARRKALASRRPHPKPSSSMLVEDVSITSSTDEVKDDESASKSIDPGSSTRPGEDKTGAIQGVPELGSAIANPSSIRKKRLRPDAQPWQPLSTLSTISSNTNRGASVAAPEGLTGGAKRLRPTATVFVPPALKSESIRSTSVTDRVDTRPSAVPFVQPQLARSEDYKDTSFRFTFPVSLGSHDARRVVGHQESSTTLRPAAMPFVPFRFGVTLPSRPSLSSQTSIEPINPLPMSRNRETNNRADFNGTKEETLASLPSSQERFVPSKGCHDDTSLSDASTPELKAEPRSSPVVPMGRNRADTVAFGPPATTPEPRKQMSQDLEPRIFNVPEPTAQQPDLYLDRSTAPSPEPHQGGSGGRSPQVGLEVSPGLVYFEDDIPGMVLDRLGEDRLGHELGSPNNQASQINLNHEQQNGTTNPILEKITAILEEHSRLLTSLHASTHQLSDEKTQPQSTKEHEVEETRSRELFTAILTGQHAILTKFDDVASTHLEDQGTLHEAIMALRAAEDAAEHRAHASRDQLTLIGALEAQLEERDGAVELSKKEKMMLEEELLHARMEKDQMRAQMEKLKRIVADAEVGGNKVRGESDSNSARAVAAEEERDALAKDVLEGRMVREKLEKELEAVNDQLIQQRDSTESALEAKRTAVDALNNATKNFSTVRDALTDAHTELEHLRAERLSSEADRKLLQSQRDSFESRAEAAEAKLRPELPAAASTLAELTLSSTTFQEEVLARMAKLDENMHESMGSRVKEYEAVLDRNRVLQAEADELRDKLQYSIEEFSKLQISTNTMLHSKSAEIETLSARVQIVKEKSNEMQTEAKELQADVERLKEEKMRWIIVAKEREATIRMSEIRFQALTQENIYWRQFALEHDRRRFKAYLATKPFQSGGSDVYPRPRSEIVKDGDKHGPVQTDARPRTSSDVTATVGDRKDTTSSDLGRSVSSSSTVIDNEDQGHGLVSKPVAEQHGGGTWWSKADVE